jgi:galactofuranosylgalactofuranosylrhamnosyl-N-acetylglucosaminyl-diphospho-decaprenol beta-1,5/1,6-galactofuranosyltransferase
MTPKINLLSVNSISPDKEFSQVQTFIFPKLDVCTVEELYFRTQEQVIFDYETNTLKLEKDAIVSFDTYFNGFCVGNWKSYTKVKNISACLKLQGYLKVKIFNIDTLGEANTLLSQKIINNKTFDEVTVLDNLDISSYTGMIYIEIQALEDDCLVGDGYFYSDAQQDRNVKFAVVICTYKRESFVYRNIKLLNKYLFNLENWQDKLEIFIVDNGRTLENIENSIIHVIPNKNAGGSGGFTRGMLEVLKREQEFSHTILMDDDIVIEPEVFDRLWNFFSVANQPNLCVGGSMLRLDKKYIQNERGAYWDKNKGFIPIKQNLNLSELKNTLFNEIEDYTDYSGWWFFCLSTAIIKNCGLPYPFFVRLDDVELCKRITNKTYKIITFNGICVWHEVFENKFNPSVYYYDTRNGLILNSLYFSDNYERKDAIKWFLKPALKELFCYRYETATHILKAASDFLKGPEALVAIAPDEKHKEISKVIEKPAKNPELPFIYSKYLDSIHQSEKTFQRIFRIFTFNGHLLPLLFFYSAKTFTDKGYKIAPFWGSKPLNVFRAKKVLYYNLQTKEGFVVQFSRKRFFQVLVNTIWLAIVMFFKYPKVQKEYIKSMSKFTTQEFWEKYLEIE